MDENKCNLHYVLRVILIAEQLCGEQRGGANVAANEQRERIGVAARRREKQPGILVCVTVHVAVTARESSACSVDVCRTCVNVRPDDGVQEMDVLCDCRIISIVPHVRHNGIV
jgi:hypothetical protein